MSSSDQIVADKKREAAQRERAAAEALLRERDTLTGVLSRRAERAAATRQFAPDVGGRLSREQLDAFEEEAAEHRARANLLEAEADRVEARPEADGEDLLPADDLHYVRTKLAVTAEGALRTAVSRLDNARGGRMSDEGFTSFMKSVRSLVDTTRFDEQLGEMERRSREHSTLRVTNEPRTYGPESPHSYFHDRMTIADGDGAIAIAAQTRMQRYGLELAHEVRRGSEEGRRVERLIGEEHRQDAVEPNRQMVKERVAEMRALGSGGGSLASAGSGAAAFVSPYFALAKWAPFRGVHRTFADQCDSEPLPPFGLEVYIPAFTSATSTTQQTEGAAVSGIDPSTGFQSAAIVTATGEVTLSQQLSDRGFVGGGSFDAIIGKQLQQQLSESIEKYVLTQALAGAATVTGQSAFTIAGLYQDLAAGRGKLTDTAGTRLRPTHLFTTSDFYSYVTRQVDDQHRPIVVPQFAPGYPIAQGDEQTQWSRFTGTVLPGGVLWFEADGITTVGTTSETQLIISAPDEAVVLFEGDPILSIFPQTDAASLELVANLRAYVAAVTRYPNGTASIYGAAYTSALV